MRIRGRSGNWSGIWGCVHEWRSMRQSFCYNRRCWRCGTSMINGTVMIPQGSWAWEKPGKTFIQGFFEPYNFLKGWGQVSNKYIQHIYSYSTLSNYSKAQHGWGNEFANTIGTHQWSLRNHSGNDVILGGIMQIADRNEFWLIWYSDAKDRTTLMRLM